MRTASQLRAEARLRRAAVQCARKLHAAAESLQTLMAAANEFGQGAEVKAADDGRITMSHNLTEYACWLESVYGSGT